MPSSTDPVDGPWFDDHLVILTIDGRDAHVAYSGAGLDENGFPTLHSIAERAL